MLPTQLKVLRVFGLPSGDISAELRSAKAEGCPGLRLLERDGEYAICVQVSAPTQEMADAHCDKWIQKLRARFGDAVYAIGEMSLAQAALNALLERRRLLVAADETTGRLLSAPLRPLQHSEAAFDFGSETWGNPQRAARLTQQPAWLGKFPGDVVQAAAARAQNALALGGADYAAMYMPATVGQGPFVLLCDKRSAWACALAPEAGDAVIANTILDLGRRRTQNLRPGPGTITFRPGHERPLLLVSGEGEPRGNTTRFSLRRAHPTPGAQDFEPMLDFDGIPGPQPAPPQKAELGTGTITFDAPVEELVARHAAQREQPVPPRQKPQPIRRAPQPSVLDQEVPDFKVDPDAVAAARAADDADAAAGRVRGTSDLQQAATKLFEAPEDPAPAGFAPSRSRSLEVIEKSERRRQRTVVMGLAALLLAALAIAGGVWWFLRNDLGARPNSKNYGTTLFDETASRYLSAAVEKRPGVLGYLAFPGLDGQFVYPEGTVSDDPDAAPFAAFDGANLLGLSTASNTVIHCGGKLLSGLDRLENFQNNSGFTLYQQNGSWRFKTLAVYYLDSDSTLLAQRDLSAYYDYLSFVTGVKARSLFDTGIEVGDGSRFLTLTAASTEDGVTLCVTGRLIEEGESAYLDPSAIQLTEQPLLSDTQYRISGLSKPDVTGLLSQQVSWYASQSLVRPQAADPSGEPGTEENGDLSERIDALNQQTQTILTSTDEFLKGLTDVAGQSNAAETDLNQGAAGGLPEQTITVEELAESTPAPTQAPTQAPTEAPAQEPDAPSPEESGEPQPTQPPEQPTEAPAEPQPPAGETINVTMNGTPQTMDLVECLAMVAQNELGPSAPAEAYKAQCVATHCWILSQGGYPSVLGQTPGAAARAAAEEVARVLVTYNGQVCFTPYFASASTGTASSKEVWGGERPWLQAVDSPYDQQVATNWHTNGATSGSARFARQTLQDRILDKMGVDLSGLDPNQWFTILSANEYGWVSQVQIGLNESGNDTCSGRWFRENLLARQSVDGRSLRSQCFTFTYDAELDCFIFDVYGYGHGCGLSQWGAIGYAQNGWDYQSILTNYFPGTTITTY